MLATRQLVERWLGNVNVAPVDELPHLPEKEGQIQRADMRPIHVSIRHDNDAVIPEFLRIKFVFANTTAEGRHKIADLGRAEHLVEARLLHIQNLAFKRQDRLELAVATLLG